MENKPTIEVVIDSANSAIAAKEGGASRVELCDNLFEGGTTPSAGMIQVVRSQIDIDLFVMIRPRGGDFLYSGLEYEIMKTDIQVAKDLRADGIVFGILNADGSVDEKRNRELVALARPLKVTFHRAFDMTRDPFEALEALIDLNFDRILTSGQERTVLEGIDLITELVKRSNERVVIMPGGGINERNIDKIRFVTKAKEFHISGRTRYSSKMEFQRPYVLMGGGLHQDEYSTSIADKEKIRQVFNNLSRL